MLKFKKIIFILLLLLLIVPMVYVNAATLYFDSPQSQYKPGDILEADMKIRMDENDKCINTIEGYVNFINSDIKVDNFSFADSIFPLWVEQPGADDVEGINNKGQIYFAGGIPGGYCYQADNTDSVIGKIFFRVLDNPGQATTTLAYLDKSKIYLNDGLGTALLASNEMFNIGLNASSSQPSIQAFENLVGEDKIPPENFKIEVAKIPNNINGKFFAVFLTTDKQSGIDHYEIAEIPLNDSLKKDLEIGWQNAQSPYELSDQILQSKILVKAVDKAGNEKIAEYLPPPPPLPPTTPTPSPMLSFFIPGMISFGVLIIIILIVLLFRKIKKKKNK